MSSLVRASEAASLALHATAVMAGRDGEPIKTGAIAEELGASEAHLAKVLQRLTKAGIVSGTRGPGGGFRLTRDAGAITLREVYEAMEGPLTVAPCMLGVRVCGKKECPLGNLFGELGREVRESLGRMTLADVRFQF